MGTSELVEKIHADGRARAAAIAAERDRAVEERRKRSTAEVSAIESDCAAGSRRDSEAILERARSRARLEQRNAVLAARWRVLDAVVRRAQERVLADPNYGDTMVQLVKKYARPDSVVRFSPTDSRSFGARLGLTLGEPASIAGGVIIRTGKEELSFSLNEALQTLRDDLAPNLSRILFESADGQGSGEAPANPAGEPSPSR